MAFLPLYLSLIHIFMKQGFVTKDGLEVFSEACKLYENDGGNGVVKQKIEPEVMRLPVK